MPRIIFRLLGGVLLTLSLATRAASLHPGEAAVRLVLTEGVHPDIELPRDTDRWRDALLSLYEKRRFEPLWLAERQLTPSGIAVLLEMRAAEARGLRSADYDGNRLAYLAIDLATNPAAAAEDVAFVDVAISIAAARFAADLHAGRIDPRDAGHDLDVPPSRLDVQSAMLALSSATDVRRALDDLEPNLRHYDLLKAALARYRLLAIEPELTHLPPPGRPSIKPGEPYAGAPALRRLLRALGDLKTPADQDPLPELQNVIDAHLAQALIHFQYRHGLQQDGTLGPATFRELTTPLERRVRQIELSLERARWLPPTLDSPPILVNIPQFKLFAFHTTQDDEKSMLRMDVIVGTTFPAHRTPVFAADMRYIVLNPYWDVPYSILVRELLPSIRADPSWVRRNGYEIVRGQADHAAVLDATPENVEALARGALRLRQRPGPDNALGFVKFMFPNLHNVYLHGTPAMRLFAQARRAFSHGCVRVSDPHGLIRHVLRDDPSWTSERIAAAISTGATIRIPLRKPIRVFLLYATAIETESGDTLFFDDIYEHDARLEALLEARAPRAPSRSRIARAPYPDARSPTVRSTRRHRGARPLRDRAAASTSSS